MHIKFLSLFILGIFIIIVPVNAAISQYNMSDGSYHIKIFNGTGTLNFSIPATTGTIQYFIVAGGGAGGSDTAGNGGGGGAGGVIQGIMQLSPSSPLKITVGIGGTYVDNKWGNNGATSSIQNSTSSAISATGGGGGGTYATSYYAGRNGGSGGGASQWSGNIISGGIGSQGSNGGGSLSDVQIGASGGGGYSETGFISTEIGGKGGNGTQSNITGILTWYAGGGAGGSHSSASTNGGGGLGGGGIGHISNIVFLATSGVNGLGAGGGGGGETTNGGNGGSGIVIIRYLETAPTASFILKLYDTSSGNPTDWRWYVTNLTGNNTEILFSNEQNPPITLGAGNWLIKLIASNIGGANTSQLKTISLNLTSPEVYFWRRIA